MKRQVSVLFHDFLPDIYSTTAKASCTAGYGSPLPFFFIKESDSYENKGK